MGNSPFLAYIMPVGEGAIDPGFGNRPIHHPGHPDHGLPSQPPRPGQGLPPFPSQGLPGSGGGRPDQGLPPHPDQGLPAGEEIHIDNELPPVPPQYEDKVIVGIKKPDEEWRFMAYDVGEIDNSLPPAPDQGLPQPEPTPQAHQQGRGAPPPRRR